MIELQWQRSYTEPAGAAEEDRRVAEALIPELEQIDDHLGLAKAWWLLSESHLIAGRWGAEDGCARASDRPRTAVAGRQDSFTSSSCSTSRLCTTARRRCRRRCARAPRCWPKPQRRRRSRRASRPRSPGFVRWRAGSPRRASCTRSSISVYQEFGLRFRRAARAIVGAQIECFAGDLAAAEQRAPHAATPCSRRWVRAASVRCWRASSPTSSRCRPTMSRPSGLSRSRARPRPRRTSCRRCCGDARWRGRARGAVTRRRPRNWHGPPSDSRRGRTLSTSGQASLVALGEVLRDAGESADASASLEEAPRAVRAQGEPRGDTGSRRGRRIRSLTFPSGDPRRRITSPEEVGNDARRPARASTKAARALAAQRPSGGARGRRGALAQDAILDAYTDRA